MNTHDIGFSPRKFAVAALLSVGLVLTGCKSNTSPAAATDDGSLMKEVQSRLAADSALSSEAIQAGVQNGIVTLNGKVSNEAARSLAAADVSQVPGIKTVVNNLSVEAPTPAPVATTAPAPEVKAEPKPEPRRKAETKPAKRTPAPIERPAISEAAPPPPAPAPVAAPAPPPPPAFRTVTLPAGTTIPVRITQTLSSATAQQGQSFSGALASDLTADGLVAIRQGTTVNGRVTAVQEAAHYKGSSLLSVELVSINRRGDALSVATQPYSVEGKGRGKNTAAKVGGGAAIGAIIGAIAGGGRGAAIGSAAGAGVGAGANTITRGEQVQIPSESVVNFTLTDTLTIRVSTSDASGSTTPRQRRRPINSPDGAGQDQPQ
jgi:outer membrane biosynthesis protein TonB